MSKICNIVAHTISAQNDKTQNHSQQSLKAPSYEPLYECDFEFENEEIPPPKINEQKNEPMLEFEELSEQRIEREDERLWASLPEPRNYQRVKREHEYYGDDSYYYLDQFQQCLWQYNYDDSEYKETEEEMEIGEEIDINQLKAGDFVLIEILGPRLFNGIVIGVSPNSFLLQNVNLCAEGKQIPQKGPEETIRFPNRVVVGINRLYN
ncbi:Hypothetical_protein [Hexamita inflata]|uniref:Hypothetical_protein n=1 Tax=Hexamita inflata TaxID=28002 RepID=A0ABP1HJI6_9EUKA